MASKWDDRNKEIYAYIDGEIVERSKACLPLWDSGFLHGKQIWSSPRLVNGKVFRLEDHLEKIQHGIKAMNCKVVPSNDEFIDAIRQALIANNMQGASDVHIRIIFTPGTQVTASMNQKAIVNWDGTPSKPRIIVMPEWRGGVYSKSEKAILSQYYRRPSPEYADQRIHSNNQIHSSLACDEATQAGVAACFLLDSNGHLAETHASHMAIVKDNIFYTPKVRCCPPGVTRKVLLELCQEHSIEAHEDDIAVDRLYDADEVMIMGTMSGPIGITHVDNKVIGDGQIGPVTENLQKLYRTATFDDKHLYDILAY
mmetsp:Transcript_22866/g.25776  ORF Transcript_22866/g.25776 Transcript_22866/m.25776 type:complete len:312 (+) Transcript_22866:277-1212(+)